MAVEATALPDVAYRDVERFPGDTIPLHEVRLENYSLTCCACSEHSPNSCHYSRGRSPATSLQTVFAFLSAPITDVSRLPPTALWIWLNLLQFCVSNQSINPEEDASNKPWRPIPSRRISVNTARVLRWALLPTCLILSFKCNALLPGLVLTLAFLLHNELNLGSHWVLRNVCNSVGYAAFNAGATAIACACTSRRSRTPIVILTETAVLIMPNSARIYDRQSHDGILRVQCAHHLHHHLRPRLSRCRRRQPSR